MGTVSAVLCFNPAKFIECRLRSLSAHIAARRQRLVDQTVDWSNGGFLAHPNPRRVKIRQKSSAPPTRALAEKPVRIIRRATRSRHSAKNKIRIVLEGLESKESIENIGK